MSEFIVERERLENTLGAALSAELKETSFRSNLDKDLIKELVAFRDLPYEAFKRKAESTDQEMREQKLGPYSVKAANQDGSASGKGTSRNNSGKSAAKSSSTANDQKSSKQKPKTGAKPEEPSRNQMRKEGLCFTCKQEGHIAKDCPQKPKDIENNSIQICSTHTENKTARIKQSAKADGRSYRDVVSNKPKVTVPTAAIHDETNSKPKPPPLVTTIPINGIPAKTLIDTGSSDDFVGTHFLTTNRVSVQRHEMPLPIQQAVRGSKPKSNATAQVNIQFGEWTLPVKAHAACLANYDAIIGVPTLTEGDVVIYTAAKKVHFRQWDLILDCELPKIPPSKVSNPKSKKGKSTARRAPAIPTTNPRGEEQVAKRRSPHTAATTMPTTGERLIKDGRGEVNEDGGREDPELKFGIADINPECSDRPLSPTDSPTDSLK